MDAKRTNRQRLISMHETGPDPSGSLMQDVVDEFGGDTFTG
jgi:hypothetical protein